MLNGMQNFQDLGPPLWLGACGRMEIISFTCWDVYYSITRLSVVEDRDEVHSRDKRFI